jgi:hypothetical protein
MPLSSDFLEVFLTDSAERRLQAFKSLLSDRAVSG